MNYCVFDVENYDYPVPIEYFHTYEEALEWVEQQFHPGDYEIVKR